MQPKTYYFNEHSIDQSLIDRDALTVLEKLRDAGFIAYLVGGSVRDLLINRHPKDFDISTSALPEQIKSIFNRQCILIGRRFRLAHIRFGHKVIEVATFRSGENDSDLITQDNVWGTPAQDVLRRDFTINGLYYDASNQSIIDYVGGWEDIQKHLLRTIGESEVRFKQDPVRLIRLLKFHARYDFKIDPEAEQAVHTCLNEIVKSSPARILEEVFRMLESGYSTAFFRLMAQYGMLEILFPTLMNFLRTPKGKTVFHYLACADQIHRHNRHVLLDRSILAACLVYPMLETELERTYLSKKHIPHIGEITMLSTAVIKSTLIQGFSQFPRRVSALINSILVSQFRFTPLTSKKHLKEKLFNHKDFELALSFFKIRAMVDEKLVEPYTSIRNQYRLSGRHGERKHNPPPRNKYISRRSPSRAS